MNRIASVMKRWSLFLVCGALVIGTTAYADQFTATQTPVAILGNAFFRCGSLVGADFNSTADQAITITSPTTLWVGYRMVITNPSHALNTAVGGIYTAASKGGFAIVSAGTTYNVTTSTANTNGNSAAADMQGTVALNASISTLYFSLTTPEGAAATADIDLWCIPVR